MVNYGQWGLTPGGSRLWWCILITNTDRAYNEVIIMIQSFAQGPVSGRQWWETLIFARPWMFCGTCLLTANNIHQYRRVLFSQCFLQREKMDVGGLLMSRGQGVVTCLGYSQWETLPDICYDYISIPSGKWVNLSLFKIMVPILRIYIFFSLVKSILSIFLVYCGKQKNIYFLFSIKRFIALC